MRKQRPGKFASRYGGLCKYQEQVKHKSTYILIRQAQTNINYLYNKKSTHIYIYMISVPTSVTTFNQRLNTHFLNKCPEHRHRIHVIHHTSVIIIRNLSTKEKYTCYFLDEKYL